MSGIIDTKGKPLNSEHKRGHDSERVMGIRNMLNNVMQQLMKGWMQDMASDPSGATRPNDTAIDQHYICKWVEQCTTVMNSSDPVEVQPEAMANWIKEQRERKAMELPLHQVLDLEPYGFRLVGTSAKGELWVSTECALWLHDGGVAQVLMREQHQEIGVFMRSLVMMLGVEEMADLVATDYTVKELMSWLRSMRRERPAFPDEAHLIVLRERVHELAPQP